MCIAALRTPILTLFIECRSTLCFRIWRRLGRQARSFHAEAFLRLFLWNTCLRNLWRSRLWNAAGCPQDALRVKSFNAAHENFLVIIRQAAVFLLKGMF